jgi:hypothetical protein
MGKFRPFSNSEPKDYDNFYNNKNNLVTLKYIRTHNCEYNNIINPNFTLNYVRNCKEIVKYASYETFIGIATSASKASASTENNKVGNICNLVINKLPVNIIDETYKKC